eukprot:TRINITY_DN4968_c0_g1_i1.p1 TRINITY_DN4968_c0_g1~~TRINITY_DN4968_c0_g1_i1.p1  ORF type:complete len:126 (-),score=27.87 TRINITY_DN4968_c0_g1_i1:97-474(-)
MAFKQPARETTITISFVLLTLTIAAIRLFREKLASTPQFTILGGFLSSLVFFFGIIALGNFRRELKWLETIVSLVVAEIAAVTIHGVCVTTCFLFSAGILFYVNHMSKVITKKVEASQSQGKKKQ